LKNKNAHLPVHARATRGLHTQLRRIDTQRFYNLRTRLHMASDFISLSELSRLIGYSPQTLRNWHCSGTGPLAGILTKISPGKLGCWRSDYEAWRGTQFKLRPAEQPQAA
jgi:hypothetical protein